MGDHSSIGVVVGLASGVTIRGKMNSDEIPDLFDNQKGFSEAYIFLTDVRPEGDRLVRQVTVFTKHIEWLAVDE